MLISIRHKLTLGIKEMQPRLLLHLLTTPQSGPSQKVLDWSLDLSADAHRVSMLDGFGNSVLFASLTNVAEPLEITLSGTIETLPGNGVLGLPPDEPVPWLYHRVTPTTRAPVSLWGKFRGEVSQPNGQLGVLHNLMARVHELYQAQAAEQTHAMSQESEDGSASQSQKQSTAEKGPVSTREQAEMFIGGARALGIPARFVSGYLTSEAGGPDGGPHGWAEAFVEGLGWIGFDPGLDLCPTERHVRMAVGLDALSASAVRAYPIVGETEIPVEMTEIAVAEGVAQ